MDLGHPAPFIIRVRAGNTNDIGGTVDRPIVLCGLGMVGWRVLASLRATGAAVTVVDLHAREGDPRLAGVGVVRGDCRHPDVLERANISAAGGVLVVTSDDAVNVATALLVRKLNADARIVVRMFNQNLIARLGGAMRNTVALSVSALTAPLIALAAVSGESLAAFNVGAQPQQLAEIPVPPNSPHLGMTLAEVAARLHLLVVGHIPADGPAALVNEVRGETELAAGDRLVVCGGPNQVAALTATAGLTPIGGRWAAPLLRTVRRAFAAVDLPVKVATAVVFVTLLASTLVFRFGVGSGWADSVYQTVGVAATGDSLHAEDQPGWVKVFVSGLKLVGAGLIATFTAVFTNYLLKMRLGGALEERRIPDRGHVVVCGLGNIGFRCIEALLALGLKVVAVEQDGDSPFVSTVRRMGVAVVVGDATVAEVLRQARVETARAVVAVTSAELANLEIALLVREQNAAQRVVVRMTDPEFAQAARDAAGIRLAFSPPAMAGPAFAAALLGDRIQAVATVGGRTLAVVDLVAQPGDDLLTDRSLQELMIDFRLMPVGVAGREPFAAAGIPKGLRFAAGDKLTCAVELAELERLLRRERPASEWAVLVDEYPPTAAGELIPVVQVARGCSHDEAKRLLDGSAFTLAERVTRGQAAELHSRLTREKVKVRVVKAEGPSPT